MTSKADNSVQDSSEPVVGNRLWLQNRIVHNVNALSAASRFQQQIISRRIGYSPLLAHVQRRLERLSGSRPDQQFIFTRPIQHPTRTDPSASLASQSAAGNISASAAPGRQQELVPTVEHLHTAVESRRISGKAADGGNQAMPTGSARTNLQMESVAPAPAKGLVIRVESQETTGAPTVSMPGTAAPVPPTEKVVRAKPQETVETQASHGPALVSRPRGAEPAPADGKVMGVESQASGLPVASQLESAAPAPSEGKVLRVESQVPARSPNIVAEELPSRPPVRTIDVQSSGEPAATFLPKRQAVNHTFPAEIQLAGALKVARRKMKMTPGDLVKARKHSRLSVLTDHVQRDADREQGIAAIPLRSRATVIRQKSTADGAASSGDIPASRFRSEESLIHPQDPRGLASGFSPGSSSGDGTAGLPVIDVIGANRPVVRPIHAPQIVVQPRMIDEAQANPLNMMPTVKTLLQRDYSNLRKIQETGGAVPETRRFSAGSISDLVISRRQETGGERATSLPLVQVAHDVSDSVIQRSPSEAAQSANVAQQEDMPATSTEERSPDIGPSTLADGPGSVSDVNIEKLAERVSRLLRRQLEVERERRGWE